MATLRRPTRTFNFTEWVNARPGAMLPTDHLDAVLDDLRGSLISTQEALAEVRRDDGQLRNRTVGAEHLKPALIDNLTGNVTRMTDAMVATVERAVNAHTVHIEDIRLLAQDAEAAAVSAAQFLSAMKSIEARVLEVTTRAEGTNDSVAMYTTEAENYATYARDQALLAKHAEEEALKWAEYLAGPVVTGPDAPTYIAESPYPRGLFYQPVEGFGGNGGLWSAKWWAIYCQQLVGFISFYYLGGWDHPPAPGEVNPDTGQMVPDPLSPGSIYYDTVRDELRVWNGDTWMTPFSLTGGLTSRFSYKATASQTVFFGPDLFAKTPAFASDDQHDVHVNGVQLVRDDGSGKGDYTVDAATDKLTLLAPVTVNSVVQWDLLVSSAKIAPGAATIYKVSTLMPDGVTTDFSLTYSGPGGTTAPVINKSSELIVVLDGVQQEPTVDYSATGATLHMNAAPLSNARLWAVYFKPGGP
jgi:hypothetical protein